MAMIYRENLDEINTICNFTDQDVSSVEQKLPFELFDAGTGAKEIIFRRKRKKMFYPLFG